MFVTNSNSHQSLCNSQGHNWLRHVGSMFFFCFFSEIFTILMLSQLSQIHCRPRWNCLCLINIKCGCGMFYQLVLEVKISVSLKKGKRHHIHFLTSCDVKRFSFFSRCLCCSRWTEPSQRAFFLILHPSRCLKRFMSFWINRAAADCCVSPKFTHIWFVIVLKKINQSFLFCSVQHLTNIYTETFNGLKWLIN